LDFFHVLFAGMTMGAIWSTGRSLPIAGGETPAQPWQERVVQILLVVGAFGTAATVLAVLVQWNWIAA
jgi:hypothetical protein